MNHTLRGSTLAETLVMMLVAGIVLLAAMDALTLLSRLVGQRTAALTETARQRDGVLRIGQLLAAADSIGSGADGSDGQLRLCRAGHETALAAGDSAVLFVAGEFRDTLLRHVGRMRLMRSAAAADTLEIDVQGHTLRLAVQRPARQRYETAIAEIENGYGYEDDHP